MYKTLQTYSQNKKYLFFPFEASQSYIAQNNREIQSLAYAARDYNMQIARGDRGKNSYVFSKELAYKKKNNYCSKK